MVRVVCVLAVVGAGVLAALASGRAATGATIVAVTAGSPTEFAFHLPRVAATGAGTFVFRIRNAGRRPHTFEICTTPVASAAANTCVGKVTKTIPAGRSATLTVTLATPGRYEFLSTLRGEAKRGMKGLFVVETAPPAVQTTTTSAWGPTGSCTNPQTTTLNVTAFDYGFTLSQNPVPCGAITIVQTNTGRVPHNFDLNGNAVATYLNNPGESSSLTLTLPPGRYRYVCDITGHDTLGMVGTLVVSG